MKRILISGRYDYVAGFSIFLITVGLIVGLVGCAFTPTPQHNLAIASTAGGSVPTPGEGTSTYAEGTVVNLVATSDSCYYFVNWTGDVSTVADVNASATTITMNDDYSITANFAGEEIVFPDPNLNAAVREAIGKSVGPICPSYLDQMTTLDAREKNITDLTGLEYATSLTWLDLGFNQISDISTLASLTNLEFLYLSYTQVSDISPLAYHTSLTVLYLSSNQISEISSLANLAGLTYLHLAHNQISDISPLANLTHMASLNLGDNQISDISPLANLTNLAGLWLYDNQISGISPLVDNEGLSEGDEVHVWGNLLSSDSINIYIPQLEARGVTVDY